MRRPMHQPRQRACVSLPALVTQGPSRENHVAAWRALSKRRSTTRIAGRSEQRGSEKLHHDSGSYYIRSLQYGVTSAE